MDKIKDAAESETVDEFVKLLHREEFRVDVFKAMVKCSRDCQLITEDIIKKNENG